MLFVHHSTISLFFFFGFYITNTSNTSLSTFFFHEYSLDKDPKYLVLQQSIPLEDQNIVRLEVSSRLTAHPFLSMILIRRSHLFSFPSPTDLIFDQFHLLMNDRFPEVLSISLMKR